MVEGCRDSGTKQQQPKENSYLAFEGDGRISQTVGDVQPFALRNLHRSRMKRSSFPFIG